MPQSDSTRRVPIVDPMTIVVAQKLVALKWSYNCVIGYWDRSFTKIAGKKEGSGRGRR